MSLLSAIFALEDLWIHVYVLNSGDIAFYIEAPINQILSLTTTLNILYIKPNNCYI